MTPEEMDRWQKWRDQLENELIVRNVVSPKHINERTDAELISIAESAGLHVAPKPQEGK